MTLPLEGVRVIDFTCVQSGPTCTQLMAWFGADVIKVEMPGVGDVTRHQLRDIPDADALYFTMMNSNKRSLELNMKTPEGKEIMTKLIQGADVLVENFKPGAFDSFGFTWEKIHEINPKLIFGSIKGFDENSPYKYVKAYDNVAQCAGGATSTTGFWDGPPTVSAAALGDSNTGTHLLIGLLAALLQRDKTGEGQKVTMSMQDACLNLCRVKLRDQQRLDKLGYLEEYPQYSLNLPFGKSVPRGGNAGGGGQPGWVLKCKGWETDPDSYIYFTIQEQNWADTAKAINKPEWANDPKYDTAKAREHIIFDIFKEIESFIASAGYDKYAAVDYFTKFGIPAAPVLSMKEIENDQSLRDSGTVVEVPHNVRGPYLTVGCPMKFSSFTPKITQSPLLGEHNSEVLKELGYNDAQIAEFKQKGAI